MLLLRSLVQAFCVNPISYHCINFAVFPLWLASESIEPFHLPNIKKNMYWCEMYNINIPQWRGVPMDIYYYRKASNEIVLDFKSVSDFVEKEVIPIFDQITDFESYIQWLTKSYLNNTMGRLFQCHHPVSCYSLIYKSYLDGNFDFSRSFFKANRELKYERLFTCSGISRDENKQIPYEKKCLEEQIAHFDKMQNER